MEVKLQSENLELKNDAVVKFFRLSNHATPPRKSTENAAGLDLFSAHNVTIPAWGGCVRIETDLQILIPEGCYGRIASRSSLAYQNVHVMAGVVDADFWGNLAVLLLNMTDADFEVRRGDSIGQIILEKIYSPSIVESKIIHPATARREHGFGLDSSTADSPKELGK